MTTQANNETLPPSLAVVPNIPWEQQTLDQLIAERDHWQRRVESAPGFASAWAADNFRRGCERWIEIRQQEDLGHDSGAAADGVNGQRGAAKGRGVRA